MSEPVEAPPPSAPVCSNCSHPEIEPHYATPLCADCRTQLVKRPIPIWISAIGVLALLLMLIAFTKFPAALRAGIAYDRGQKAEASGKYALAETNYLIASKQYPDSLTTRGRVAVTAFDAGDYGTAADMLDSLANKDMDKDEADELNALGDKIDAKLKELKQQQGQGGSAQ